jgi:hypothetical protein
VIKLRTLRERVFPGLSEWIHPIHLNVTKWKKEVFEEVREMNQKKEDRFGTWEGFSLPSLDLKMEKGTQIKKLDRRGQASVITQLTWRKCISVLQSQGTGFI